MKTEFKASFLKAIKKIKDQQLKTRRLERNFYQHVVFNYQLIPAERFE